VSAHRRREGQRRRGRVAGPEPDERARIEVAGRRLPGPAVPPLASGLALRPQPKALGRAGARELGEVVAGRAGLGDGADQKSALAAFMVAAPR
jgi:hypothetical protein